MTSEWDTLTTDFKSGLWMHSFCQIPFLDAQFKRFGEEQGGAPWKALDVGCGMGKHIMRLLQAGASYVLAFDVSKEMVAGAKMEADKFLHSQALPGSRVDFLVASATDVSSIPEEQEGTFDLAICIYVLCNLLSKEEVKQALAESYKMLKPGGKLMIYETHVIQYTQWDDKDTTPILYKWGKSQWDDKDTTPKWQIWFITVQCFTSRSAIFSLDTANNFFSHCKNIVMRMNSGRDIRFTNRLYTLSSWVSWILEAGFQITQFMEPGIDPKAIPADAPDYVKFGIGKPIGMCWECTKPLSQ